jgi:hypothetical protein
MTSTDPKVEREALLLPLLVNGTLDEESLAEVNQYLQRSPSARDEASFLHFVRDSLKEIDRVEGPSELERQHILRRIERTAQSKPWPPPARWGLVAALALALAQATVIGYLATPRGLAPVVQAGGSEPAYRPAGAQPSAALAVQFTEDATARQIRDLLLERGLLVVDGPSAIGVYGLVPANPAADAGAIQEILALLQAEDIVSYASLR